MINQSNDISGLILAGGRGTRMGGVDKGLQLHLGVPLAQHALERLRPQVAALMLNANRNLPAYQAMGVPVWPDEMADFPGPLAGMLAGLMHGRTPYLVTVPCDSPNFPDDLVARLVAWPAERRVGFGDRVHPGGRRVAGAAGVLSHEGLAARQSARLH